MSHKQQSKLPNVRFTLRDHVPRQPFLPTDSNSAVQHQFRVGRVVGGVVLQQFYSFSVQLCLEKFGKFEHIDVLVIAGYIHANQAKHIKRQKNRFVEFGRFTVYKQVCLSLTESDITRTRRTTRTTSASYL